MNHNYVYITATVLNTFQSDWKR